MLEYLYYIMGWEDEEEVEPDPVVIKHRHLVNKTIKASSEIKLKKITPASWCDSRIYQPDIKIKERCKNPVVSVKVKNKKKYHHTKRGEDMMSSTYLIK